MDVGAPEAGLPIGKDMIAVLGMHEVLVRKYEASPIKLKFVLDSQRRERVDGHFEMEYEFSSGSELSIRAKLNGNDMVFEIYKARGRFNFSIDIRKCVSDDLVPISKSEYEDMVAHWLRA